MPYGVLRQHITQGAAKDLSQSGSNNTGKVAEANLGEVETPATVTAEVESKSRRVTDFGHACNSKPEGRKKDGGIGEHLVRLNERSTPALAFRRRRWTKLESRKKCGRLRL